MIRSGKLFIYSFIQTFTEYAEIPSIVPGSGDRKVERYPVPALEELSAVKNGGGVGENPEI